MNTILQDSPVSYYRQLYSILRDELAGGKWQPGERMPSEAELIVAYGVSRITVRQAFELLVNEGLVYRRRGSGTFVNDSSFATASNRLIGFAADMERRGMQPVTEMVGSRLEPASADMARRLDIETGAELAVLERLRKADGVPMCFERLYLVHHLCPDVLDGDYNETPMHVVLLNRYGIHLTRAQQAARAVAAEEGIAKRLQVAAGSPLLFVERLTRQQSGIPIEFRQLFYRGDRYILFNELHA